MSSPADLGVGAAVAEVRAGRLSAVELVEAALERISAREEDVNAWIHVDREGAVEAARAVGDGPLAGIPIGVKDIVDVAGMPTTAGAAGWVRRPEADAPVVARLRAAGAVIVGKTNTNEFAYGIHGLNPHHGDCRNPNDPARVTGGSTSGSTAAVVAGMALGGVGSDTTGSLRTPASLCGAVGMRTSRGLVPRAGVVPLAPTYDVVGPVARTCPDAALLLAVMAGRESPDPGTSGDSSGERPPASDEPPLSGLRVGVMEELVERCEGYVVEGFREAVGVLEESGAEVVPVVVEDLARADAVHFTIQLAEAGAVHVPWFEEQAPRYAPDVRDRLEVGRLLPASAYLTAQRARRLLRARFAEAFSRVDVLAAPTTPVVAPLRAADTVDVAGREVEMRAALIDLVLPLTEAGGPVLALAIGRHDGLPFGMQLAGRPGDDFALLQIGAAYEAAVTPPRAGAPRHA